MAVIFTQVANLVGRRYEQRSGLDRGLLANPLLLLGVTLELAFAFAALFWPPLAKVLETGPLPLGIVALAAAGGPVLFVLDLARKRLAGREGPV